MPVALDVEVEGRLPAAIEAAAYFVTVEALTNVAKHSGAEHARVSIARRGETLQVEVADDGEGGADPAGAGLTGLRQRVEALDGRLAVAVGRAGNHHLERSCHAHRHRRGPGASARGADAAAARPRLGDRRRRRQRPGARRGRRRAPPDLALVDVRLPPSFTDEGVRAAIEARERVPGTPVLILSQYVEESYAGDLLASDEGGVGYLLKDRVADVRQFAESLERVANGGTAMDPEVVAQLLGRRDNRGPLAELTPRELEVLTLMAEGRSNTGIGRDLGISGERDREAHQAGVHEARPAAVRQRPPARPRRAQVPGE